MSTLFPVSGGGHTKLLLGAATNGAQQEAFDPLHWVTTFMRALKWYVESNADPGIYNVVFEFPSASDLGEFMPLPQTIIHFEIDDIQNPVFGFGDCTVQAVLDNVNQLYTAYEALTHIVNMDVGIWTSTRSGGVTARLNAYQFLNDLFAGASAYLNLQPLGMEIQSFSGGQFSKEEFNEQPIWRAFGMTLVLRIYSLKMHEAIPFVTDQVTIIPELTDVDGAALGN